MTVGCRLLTYADSGEFTVEDDGGFVHHCWPLLSIEPIGGQRKVTDGND